MAKNKYIEGAAQSLEQRPLTGPSLITYFLQMDFELVVVVVVAVVVVASYQPFSFSINLRYVKKMLKYY